MQKQTNRSVSFYPVQLEESEADLQNPGCGWYHIYTLRADPDKNPTPLEEEIWFYGSAGNERLALALINLSDFRTKAISDAALSRIGGIFDFFRKANKQVILRFVYDTQGRCFLHEPRTLSVIKRHITQVGPIIREHHNNILVSQGLLIGNWGEMHGSKFSNENALCDLAGTFYESTKGSCFLAVRTPALIRMIASCRDAPAGIDEKLALFNDGMFASATDLGTYGELDRESAGKTGKWRRSAELKWQQENLAFAPNGGEAAAGGKAVSFQYAADVMRMTYTSYMNSIYDPIQLDYWRNESAAETGCWSGISGYDYIGRHLGYRFVVRAISLGKGKELFVEVENCGFANLCREAQCMLIIESPEGTEKRRILTDPRSWRSGRITRFSTGFTLREAQKGKSFLYLSLQCTEDDEPIVFANKSAKEKLKIGELTDPK